MKVTIFVSLSDNFFKIFTPPFPMKSSQSPLQEHFYFLASNLLNIFGMHVKYNHKNK